MRADSPPPPPHWVDEPRALQALVERLRQQPRFALDTESNSLHAYTERICLVQITDQEADWIVDPLAVDLTPLGTALADPKVEKVLHGADYDVMCFKRGHGFSIANLFDTMLAERVLGRSRYGLGALLSEHFGFSADKKMQRFDWGQRPLPQHAVDYARYDTHFLLELRQMQHGALAEADRLEDHRHACERQARVEPRPRPFDPLAFWKIKGARGLRPPGPGILHALFVLRDEIARDMDRPHFRVASDATLVEVARAAPGDRRALVRVLTRVRGAHPRLRRELAPSVLDAIARGAEADPPPRETRAPSAPKDVTDRFDRLRAWRKAVAETRGVEPDIVLDKGTLMDLATADPADPDALDASGALDAWERERYGEGILATLLKARRSGR